MSFLRSLFKSPPVQAARIDPVISAGDTSGVSQAAGWFANFGGYGSNIKTLPRVSPEIALRHSTVYACTNNISMDLAKIGVQLFQRQPDGQDKRVYDHPAVWLLNNESSEGIPATVLRYSFVRAFLLRGNGYSYAPRDGGGELELLEFIHNDGVTLYRKGRARFYEFEDGAGVRRRVPSRSVAHVRHDSLDGWVGRSPITVCGESIGIALAGQEAAARGVSGATIKAYVKQGEGWADDEETIRAGRQIKEILQDPNNLGIPMLPDGAEIKTLDISPADMQLLEARKFDRQQILSIYRMPPIKVADDTSGVKAGVEQQAIDYTTDCLLSWAESVESQMAISLLTETERRAGYYFQHNLDSLLRATTKERYEALSKAIGGPFMLPNEGRGFEKLPPVEDGNRLYPPPNMTRDTDNKTEGE